MKKSVLIALVAAAVAFGGYAYTEFNGTPTQSNAEFIRSYSPRIGEVNAPVTIVEFFDPSCEACRAIYPYVKAILAENPKDVRLVMRYALFHKGSEKAARILEVARLQDKYPVVLEAVLNSQPEWHDDENAQAAWNAAVKAGLDPELAKQQMYSESVTAALESDAKDIEKLKIRKTPEFFVNGKKLEEFHPDQLYLLVQEQLAKVKK